MRGWEARGRGLVVEKKRNKGCAFCGGPYTRTIWLFGAGRILVCEGCAEKKRKEAVA